jgi:CheY-like chemotaxis protein
MENKVVLIAEDFFLIRNIIQNKLEPHGFKTLNAENAEQVLETIEKNDVDIILLNPNILMPNGKSCVKAIRSITHEKKANIPIIAITGNPFNHSLKQFQKMGFDAYLEKPINFDLLIDMLKEIIQLD